MQKITSQYDVIHFYESEQSPGYHTPLLFALRAIQPLTIIINPQTNWRASWQTQFTELC